MTDIENDAEHRLAALTNWGLFGAFGMGVVLTGFQADLILLTAAGYLMIVAGFVSHLIINRIYRMHFRTGEIATAITDVHRFDALEDPSALFTVRAAGKAMVTFT